MMRLTASSARDPEFDLTPKQRYDRAAAELMRQASERRRKAEKYMRRARNIGYDVTTDQVMAFFPWFDSWANRLIPVGHLVHRCGLRRMSRSDYLEWSRTMNIPKAVMLDTVGTSAHNIPASTPYVGGYVSGTGVVPWSAGDWALFPNARHNRIYQMPGENVDPHSWDTIDMETGAFDAEQAAQEHKRHVDAGIKLTNLYATRTNLAAGVNAIKALGGDYFIGHVTCTLADWNLDEEEAAALIGTFVEEVTCVSVQWASPESNPNTVVPGGSYTLARANVDINVTDANWIPSVSFTGMETVAPTPATQHGELVTDDGHGGMTAIELSSTDGKHWQ